MKEQVFKWLAVSLLAAGMIWLYASIAHAEVPQAQGWTQVQEDALIARQTRTIEQLSAYVAQLTTTIQKQDEELTNLKPKAKE